MARAKTRRVARTRPKPNIWKATQPLVMDSVFRPLVENLIAQGHVSRRAIKVALETEFQCAISPVTFSQIMKYLGYKATKAEVRFEPLRGTADEATRFQPGNQVVRNVRARQPIREDIPTPDEIAAEVGFDVPGASPSAPPQAGAAVLDPALLSDGPPEQLPPAVLAAIAQGQRRPRQRPNHNDNPLDSVE